MRCWSCHGEIPEGSRFCGLCGSKQDKKILRQTVVGPGGKALRSRTQTLVSTPGAPEEIVSSGGHRFAALSAAPGPAALPEDDITETLSEGVPAGALAGLLAARRDRGDPKRPRRSTTLDQDPPEAAAAHAARLAAQATQPRFDPTATTPQRAHAASAPPEATAPDRPAVTPAPSPRPEADTTPEADGLPDQPADAAAASDPGAHTQQGMPAATVLPVRVERVQRVERAVEAMPSVIVDSQFSREAHSAEQEAVAQPEADDASAPPQGADPQGADQPSDPAAEADRASTDDAPAPAQAGRSAAKGGFRETAWFLDGLDPDALRRAESADEDPRDRQARFEGEVGGDSAVRQAVSLRTQDALPAQPRGRDIDAGDAPAARSNQAGIVGLVTVIIIALGVAGWFLFGP